MNSSQYSTIDDDSTLIPINLDNINAPFLIKRIYFLHNLKNFSKRGFHSHKNLHQLILCTHGSFKIKIDDSLNQKIYSLNDSSFALYLKPGLWRELFDFAPNSICLVLASDVYSEEDYIRSYHDFLNYKLL
jgi:hypothetical protein